MSTLEEILGEGFEAHTRALPAGGGFAGGRSRSVLRSIHRRRTTRAAATAGGSVLAVGVLAFGAVNLAAPEKVRPGAYAVPTAGPDPWCNLASYPAVNLAALGAYPYAGRIYVNEADGEYVYVAPDGVKTWLEPDADGNYFATSPTGARLRAPTGFAAGTSWSHMAWDIDAANSGGGRAYFVTPDEKPYFATVDPGLLYEWTTVTSGDAPSGVDEAGILALQLQAIGFAAIYVNTSMVPTGATLEQVIRWSDGRERVTPLDPPDVSSTAVGGEDLIGLASVSIRVTGLPDGATYEVTSVYDPTKTWAAVCGTTLDFSTPSPAPSYLTPAATPAPSPSDERPLPGSSPAPTP